jgi:DNA topoisomerase VI subunit B
LAKRVQDGHTVWENVLYDALWALGGNENDVPYKDVSGGYNRLAAKTGLGDKTVMRNLRSLESKLAIVRISLEEKETSTARVYRVFSFKEVLKRRKAAGLEWVIRDRQSVVFTTSAPMVTETTDPVVKQHIPSGHRTHTPMAGTTIPRVASMVTHPVVMEPTQLDNIEKREATTTLRSLLQSQLPTFDDTAVEQLLAACCRRSPDVTPEEINWLFIQKIRGSFGRGIENQNGFLLTAVERSCTPAALASFRQYTATAGQGGEVAAESSEYLLPPESPQEELERLEYTLSMMPNHSQADVWRRRIDDLRGQGNQRK